MGTTFVRGSTAYLSAEEYTDPATGGSGETVKLHAIDLADPAAPVDRVSQSARGWGWLLDIEGDRAIVQSGWGGSGVDIYRLVPGQAPEFRQFTRTLGWWANGVSRQDDALYLARVTGAFRRSTLNSAARNVTTGQDRPSWHGRGSTGVGLDRAQIFGAMPANGSHGQEQAGAACRTLATALASRSDEVIARWEAVVGQWSVARPLSERALRDNLPRILGRLSDVLATGDLASALASDASEQHALDRLSRGFLLGDLVSEYAVLRQCVMDVVAETPGCDVSHVRIVDRVLDHAIQTAVSYYADAEPARAERGRPPLARGAGLVVVGPAAAAAVDGDHGEHRRHGHRDDPAARG